RTTRYFDGADNVVGIVDAKLVLSSMAYDAAGHVAAVMEAWNQPAQRQTTLFYDAIGNLRAQTVGQAPAAAKVAGTDLPYAHPETTNYGYDAPGRRTDVIEAAGTQEQRQTHLAYDAGGNLVARTTGLGAKRHRYNARSSA